MEEQDQRVQPKGDGSVSDEKDSASAKGGIDWADPTVPVGNAPPMSPWKVVLFAIAWVGWLGFLGAMLLSAGGATSG